MTSLMQISTRSDVTTWPSPHDSLDAVLAGDVALNSSRLAASATPRLARDNAGWHSQVGNKLSSVRALRTELVRGGKSGVEAGAAEFHGGNKPDLNTSIGGGVSSNSAGKIASKRIAEDRLKRRVVREGVIISEHAKVADSVAHTTYQVNEHLHSLQRCSAAVWTAFNIAEKRLDLRARRPSREMVQDGFQDALQTEKTQLLAVHGQLAKQIETGQEARAGLDKVKHELHRRKLTLQFDKSSLPFALCKWARGVEDTGNKFCEVAAKALSHAGRVSEKTQKMTNLRMKERLAELVVVRKRLEDEIHETRHVIEDGNRDVDRLKRDIKEHVNDPEVRFSYAKKLTKLDGNSILDHATLAKLRSAIRGAAYTGPGARQLEVLFSRCDHDNSGSLSEEELRRALRRTLKIPPSLLSDPQLTALFSLIDADGSRTVDVSELVGFLKGNIDVEMLVDEFQKKRATVQQLEAALRELVDDLRAKGAAWKIDDACQKVTAAKGLELDGLHSISVSNPLFSGSIDSFLQGSIGSEQQVVSPRRVKPLEPRLIDKLRNKIKYSDGEGGRKLEKVFSLFDGDGSGQLDEAELRKAVRSHLKLPVYSISDSEISALFLKLDLDGSGAVTIDELMKFINPDPPPPPPPRRKRSAQKPKELDPQTIVGDDELDIISKPGVFNFEPALFPAEEPESELLNMGDPSDFKQLLYGADSEMVEYAPLEIGSLNVEALCAEDGGPTSADVGERDG